MYDDQHIINEHAKESFDNYFNHGFAPGGFGTAVLANDLIGAAYKADHWNSALLASTVKWVEKNAPAGSWGSYDIVQGWLDGNEYFQAHQKKLAFDILKDPA